VAAQLCDQIKMIDDVSETRIIGGYRRTLRVALDPARLASHGITTAEIARQLSAANVASQSGALVGAEHVVAVQTGGFISSKEDLERVVVTAGGKPVFLRDVATIIDGPEEPEQYVLYGDRKVAGLENAATISVAKRKGKNASVIAEHVLAKIDMLKGKLIPSDVRIAVTRNYGETAKEKSDELLEHLLIAVVSVTILIALFLGVRAGLVVFTAVPVVLALTLAVYYFLGYTLNRVTLFALIFSIGILVDDPIVDVENIVRHFHLPENRDKSIVDTITGAITEVGSPLILATLAVIAAILPMAFVRGLMGPYMRPIPVGASVAMLLSMGVAFVITPWASARILGPLRGKYVHHAQEGALDHAYRRFMGSLISSGRRRHTFLVVVVILLLAALSLLFLKIVKVKMLPFDNKSEFQIVIDMPEGTPLEKTYQVGKELADYIRTVPEASDYQLYIGTAAPVNFNGLVRHYYLRSQPHQGDIQVNLKPKSQRSAQSHDIAKRLRPGIEAVAAKYPGGSVKIVEIPPGPPVVQTLVAEIYGPDYERQVEIAREVKQIFSSTPGVVDVFWYVEADQKKVTFSPDREKAGRLGISSMDVTETLTASIAGKVTGLLHIPTEKEDVPVLVKLPQAYRTSVEDILALKVRGARGTLVPMAEVANVDN